MIHRFSHKMNSLIILRKTKEMQMFYLWTKLFINCFKYIWCRKLFFLLGPTCNSHLNMETNFGKGIPGCPQTCGFTFNGNCTLPFAEGCKCKSGYLWDENKCVKPSDCGCKTPEGDYISVGWHFQWLTHCII